LCSTAPQGHSFAMGWLTDIFDSGEYKINRPKKLDLPKGVRPVALLNEALKIPGYKPKVFETMKFWIIFNATDPNHRRARHAARCLSDLTSGLSVSYAFMTVIDKNSGSISFPVVEVKLGSDLPKKNSATGVVTCHMFAQGLRCLARQKVAVDAGKSDSLILANTEANAKFHLCGVKYHCQHPRCRLKSDQKVYVYTSQRCSVCGHVFQETKDRYSE